MKNILFFARDYQLKLFAKLNSQLYNSFYVTLTKDEKIFLQKTYNIEPVGCFEEYFENIDEINFTDNNLTYSFFADRFLGKYSLEVRRYILSIEFRFWREIFDKIAFDAVVNEIVAFELSEVLQIEAKAHGVRHFTWMVSPFNDKCFYWQSSPFHCSLSADLFTADVDDLDIDAASHYIQSLKAEVNFKPFYAKNIDGRLSVRNVVFVHKMYLSFHLKRVLFNLSKKNELFLPFYIGDYSVVQSKIGAVYNSVFNSYDSLEKLDDYGLVFYPLHFEPEASILYMAEFFEDQLALIRNISKCLRPDQYLVVKEHPQQAGRLHTRSFKELKQRLSNVIYLPAEVPTKEVILKSEVVVTLTSTAGWEGLILGKPVVVIGKVFYDQFPSVIPFKSFSELKVIFKDKNYPVLEHGNMLRAVASFYKFCEQGNPYPHDGLYSFENITLIKEAIEMKLFSIELS